jgi:hypothetical protein
MPTYDLADYETQQFVEMVRDKYHGRLMDAGVTIGVEFADPTEADLEKGDPPFLKLHGYPAAAIVAITPARQRLRGVADAVITLDRRTWDDLDDVGREALIDHELTHLVPCFDKEGNLKSDDRGRPRLEMRLHDIVVGGFREIVRRHGLRAIESQQLRDLFSDYRQQLFRWADDMAPPDKPGPGDTGGLDFAIAPDRLPPLTGGPAEEEPRRRKKAGAAS